MKHRIEKIQLANGATLINVIVGQMPISLVSVWFRVGSRLDPAGKEGLAHLLEHLFYKKTKKFPNEIERLKAMESRGIKSSAFTSYETAHFYNIQEKEETFHSLGFLIDSLENYSFDDGDLEKEKKVVIQEMLENKSSSRDYIWNVSNQSLWQKSSMGRSFFGDSKSLKSIQKSDLEKFIKENYTPENCSFVIVGNEDTKKIAEYLNRNISLRENRKKVIIKSVEFFGNTKKISVKKNDENQAVVSVAFRVTSINGDCAENATMDFIRDYLANKWISKLNEELRLKRNVTYWVDGESVNFSDTGMMRFIFACDKKNLHESIGVVLEEIEKIKSDLIADSVLDIHKKSFASSLAIKFVDPYEYLWWYGWQATVSDREEILNVADYAKLIQKIKSSDIKNAAQKYLCKGNISISIIGNVDKSDLKELLRK